MIRAWLGPRRFALFRLIVSPLRQPFQQLDERARLVVRRYGKHVVVCQIDEGRHSFALRPTPSSGPVHQIPESELDSILAADIPIRMIL